MDELQDWLEKSWDPDLTVGEWWERLGMSGWAAPTAARRLLRPRAVAGRRARRPADDRGVRRRSGAPIGMGLMLAAPTIATHGTREQIERYIPDVVTGDRAWCQLFSEPGAGSDLAGLTTERSATATCGSSTARRSGRPAASSPTSACCSPAPIPTCPKHQGITWFAFDMHQPGVEVRPLREMTGHAMFNEVFLTDAVVPDDARIGEVNNGWAVANTTLLHERSGMGAGGGAPVRGALMALPAPSPATSTSGRATSCAPARKGGNGEWRRAHNVAGEPRPTSPSRESLGKQRRARRSGRASRRRTSSSELTRLQHRAAQGRAGRRRRHPRHRQLLQALDGPTSSGTTATSARASSARAARCMRYDDDGREALAEAAPGGVAAIMITARPSARRHCPIYGGTDQIQRNIIGERALGLPKEPGDLSSTPVQRAPEERLSALRRISGA